MFYLMTHRQSEEFQSQQSAAVLEEEIIAHHRYERNARTGHRGGACLEPRKLDFPHIKGLRREMEKDS